MRIAVSACLLGENCKYSGGNNLCPKLVDALSGHEVIPVCPEVLGGLPTPRPPAEIVHGEVRTQAGESVDAARGKAWMPRFALVPSERLITLKLLAVATLRSCSRAALPVVSQKSMMARSQAGSFQAAECSFGSCGSMACALCNRMSSLLNSQALDEWRRIDRVVCVPICERKR